MRELIREAALSARSAPVASAVTVVMIAGMILSIMLTTGKTVGAEQQVLGTIDTVATRAIEVRAEQDAGVTADVLARIATLDGVEWSGAFSGAADVTNAHVPDGAPVPLRYAYTDNPEILGIPFTTPLPAETVWASKAALHALGMIEQAGAVQIAGGHTLPVLGELQVPEFLTGLEPLVLVPSTDLGGADPVSLIIVVAESPALVAPVTQAVMSVLGAGDPSQVTVTTSEQLAQLRGIIQSQLGDFSRGLVLALFALTGGLVATLLYGLVLMRRRDFGRRRALGATRSFVVTLLLLQTLIQALIGLVAGGAASYLLLTLSGDPLPGVKFAIAIGILTVLTALLAAIVPALVASRREPIRELRVP